MKKILQFAKRNNSIHLPAIIAAIAIVALLFINVLSSQTQTSPDFNVTVSRFSPEGETDQAVNMTLRFSRDMIPDDSLDIPVLTPPLEITPHLPGIARWIDNNTLRYFPEEKLQPATQYTVEVKSSRAFLYGNRINEKRKFTFYTSPLKVSRVSTYNLYEPETPGQIKLDIDVIFNYPVAPDALAENLSIKGGKNAAKSGLSFEVYGTGEGSSETSGNQQPAKVLRVITELFELTDSRQDYALKISDRLKCVSCGKVKTSSYETTITVQKKKRLFVRELSAWYSDQQPIVQIPFSNQITSDNIKDFVTVKPELSFAAEVQYSNITLRGDFKAGKTYEISVAPGVMGRDGSILEEKFSSKITIPDIPPTVKFVSPGMYLPKNGSELIELETINIDTLSVEVEQYFANNLVFAMATNTGSSNYYRPSPGILGRTFFEKNKALEGEKNKPLTTTVDIGAIIGDSLSGIFKVSARNKERRWDFDSRLVMLTDLGIMARQSDDYLMVWVNSLKNITPIKKAEVTLWSKNNQPLLKGTTDSRGICIFNNISDQTAGFDPFLITVSHKNDLSFLEFDQCLLPTSDFDVKGRPYLTKGYEAFMYTDRGIYRPGDTLQITSIVRGTEGKLPNEFPYIITIKDPGGREFQSFRAKTGGSSFLNLPMPIPDFAQTGRYTAIAHIGEDLEIGRIEFQIEEFMPDRIKVTVDTERKSYSLADNINIDVNAKFLFGSPAKGLRVSGQVIIDPMQFTSPRYTGYSFTDDDKNFSRIYATLPDERLDESGYHAYSYEIPKTLNPPSALQGQISASVSEEGGRTVSAFTNVAINPYPRYVGVRLDFEGYVKPGEPAKASLIALNPDSTETSVDSLDVRFYRMVYHSILKKDNSGNYRYISESTPVLIDSTIVNLGKAGTSVSFTPPEYGRYRIVATDRDGGHSASASFYASGWGFSPWSMENPDRIEIDLDKKSYSSKEDANVQIRAPFGGKLLITIEKTSVLDFIVYDMDSNTAEITLPIKQDYFPTAYITATVIRKADAIEKTSPARAFGVAPIVINTDNKKIPITLRAPDEIKPRSTLQVEVETGTPGISELTLAAVDAGILQLIDFQTPDPLAFFYGKRKLGLKPYDIYSFLYPNVEKAQSNLSPAGGLYKTALREAAHLNPIQARRVKPVSLWSGIVKTDENGKALINFDVPEFNGKLVLMAVAVQNDDFGSTTAETLVRDKIILQESFPRFAAPNDVVDGLVTIFNKTGKTADIKVSIKATGPAEIISPTIQTIHLIKDADGKVIFKFKAGDNPEKVQFVIRATDGVDSSQTEFELPNRPAQPLTTLHGSGSVTADSSAQFTLPDDWLKTTASYVVQTSSLSAVEFTSNINFLVSYPYGCLEQTTSRLFPLLYFEPLAQFISPELLGSEGPNYFIQEGIIKLTGMLKADGSFSFWPNGKYFNAWASVYASHFMIEARKKGFHIENDAYKSIIGNLQNLAHGGQTEDIGDPARIYAAYALARAGEIDRKAINYLKSLQLEKLPVFSKFQVAGALALSGDKETALAILPTDIQPQIFEPETGGTFSSGVRTNAIMLEVLTEIDPSNPSAAVLANSLMKYARVGKWYTTQETAFGLMALGKYLSMQSKPDFTGTVTVDGNSFKIDTKNFKQSFRELGNNNVSISITGTGTCFYYWQASGIPLKGGPMEFTNGIKVTRQYLDNKGQPLDPSNIPLGTQVICHITAVAEDQKLENVVINDLLPAGLEIENPRLKTTPVLAWLPERNSPVTYQDIRDDRMLLFVDLTPNNEFEYYYSLRAISSGNFTIPPIASECMYNPVIGGASSSGAMTIINSEE